MTERIADFTTKINHPLSFVSTNPLVIYRKVIDTLNNIDYRFESTRLKSFKNWPHKWTKSVQFAAAGFYYTGESDTVKCFECDVEIHTWLSQHDPMLEHIRWSKRCSFIRNYRCGNIPIGADSNKISSFMREKYDMRNLYEANMMTSLQLEKNILEDVNTKNTEKISSNLSTIIPKYPEYASYDARLRTYEMSPKILSRTKEEFAAAGLFYAGNYDQTLCYYCGGKLTFWKLEDDPWEHHAKWFNHCPYLHMVKGTDYINRVTKKIYSEPDTRNIWEPSIEQDAKCPLNKLFAHECFQDLTSFKSIYGGVPLSTYVIGTRLSEPDIRNIWEPSTAQDSKCPFNEFVVHECFQDLTSFKDKSTIEWVKLPTYIRTEHSESDITEPSIAQDAKCPFNDLFAHESFQDSTSSENKLIDECVPIPEQSEPDITEPSIAQDAKCPFNDLFAHESFQDSTSSENKLIDECMPIPEQSEPDITEPSIAQDAKCPFNDLFAHESFQDSTSSENKLIDECMPIPEQSEPDITEPSIAQDAKCPFNDLFAHESFQDSTSSENELIDEWVPIPELSEPDITESSIAQDAECPLNDLFAHESFQDSTSSENELIDEWVPTPELSEPDIMEPSIAQKLKDAFDDFVLQKSFQNLAISEEIDFDESTNGRMSPIPIKMKLSESDITELSISQELEDVFNDLLDHKSFQDLIISEDKSTDDR
ncbi:uncharacterized protein [Polyergus mexicanus]|uniref:uncharacterized protein n=1 Tax=Polyergus mexicanus TaxID=615972 RepID=UPI0038B5945F